MSDDGAPVVIKGGEGVVRGLDDLSSGRSSALSGFLAEFDVGGWEADLGCDLSELIDTLGPWKEPVTTVAETSVPVAGVSGLVRPTAISGSSSTVIAGGSGAAVSSSAVSARANVLPLLRAGTVVFLAD